MLYVGNVLTDVRERLTKVEFPVGTQKPPVPQDVSNAQSSFGDMKP
jgi:hypothetical protein